MMEKKDYLNYYDKQIEENKHSYTKNNGVVLTEKDKEYGWCKFFRR